MKATRTARTALVRERRAAQNLLRIGGEMSALLFALGRLGLLNAEHHGKARDLRIAWASAALNAQAQRQLGASLKAETGAVNP